MMLEWLKELDAAKMVEDAVIRVLEKGKVKTPDLGGENKTIEFAKAIAEKI